MPSSYGKKFDKALRLLRQGIPLGAPLKVVTVPQEKIKGLCGYAAIHEEPISFKIVISRELSKVAAIDTLIHEYAHCLDHVVNGMECRKHHRNSWGVCYARCYRVSQKE